MSRIHHPSCRRLGRGAATAKGLPLTATDAQRTVPDCERVFSRAVFEATDVVKESIHSETLGLPARWQIEVAAMLSQLACITSPNETVEKLSYGQPLEEHEQESVGRLPVVTEQSFWTRQRARSSHRQGNSELIE